MFHKTLSLCHQLLALIDVAHQIHLVVLCLQRQLFPTCQQIVECIVRIVDSKGITELETFLLEAEYLQSAVVEVTIQLLVLTRIAALVQMAPDGSHCGTIAHITKMVGNDATQVFLYGKQCHGIQVGQHGMHHLQLFIAGEGMMVECFALLFNEEVGRHHQCGGVDHHQYALKVVAQQGHCA